jgi:uncharacterized protein (DUF1697 family)
MAHVVFLRAANVGGNNVFRPAKLAAELSHLDVVNVGAAGTFVVRATASAAAIRRELIARLPFLPELAIRPAKEIIALAERDPFRDEALSRDRRAWVAVLTRPAKAKPGLPLQVPAGRSWSVRFERLEGAFALGIWQRPPKGFTNPSTVVEDALGVPVTTRWWETLVKVAEIAGGS